MPEIIRSCAALSWIDPQTGLPEVDKKGHPGADIGRDVIVGEAAYRFSNFLEAAITVDDDGRITDARFTPASGMYRSPSFAGISSDPVGKIGRSKRVDGRQAVFRQIVGCRTASPEKIGSGGGAGVGVLGGAYAGAKAGAFLGPKGAVAGAVLGGIIGGVAGWFGGKEVAELVTAFPPIWSELELTIKADGTTEEDVISKSLFPSCTFYRQNRDVSLNSYRVVGNYNAVPALDRWKDHGWSDSPASDKRSGATSGNPWNMISGRDRLGGHTVNRPCPAGYTCD